MLHVNERQVTYRSGLCLASLVEEVKPDADVFIVNGYPAELKTVLSDGDVCCLIKRGETPSSEEFEHLLYARHTPGVHERVRLASVGVMGLGGLGSVVAVALARIGIGRLVLADCDIVEPSNLNRQQYFIDQIGLLKTEALRANLMRINPYIKIDTIDELLTEENIPKLFNEMDVLVECFDGAAMKAAALRAVLTDLPGMLYVTSSGLAGYGDNNLIVSRRLYPGVYVVGDGESAAEPGQGLMAPRVGIAAHHQANQVLRLLLGKDH